jgi:hypothetical protein
MSSQHGSRRPVRIRKHCRREFDDGLSMSEINRALTRWLEIRGIVDETSDIARHRAKKANALNLSDYI